MTHENNTSAAPAAMPATCDAGDPMLVELEKTNAMILRDNERLNAAHHAPAATLNENELFASFIDSKIPIEYGTKRKPRGQMFQVRDLLSGFETNGLDQVFDTLIEECSDERWTDCPTRDLWEALDEFRGVIHNLTTILNAFEIFKVEHLIGDPEEDEVWRYRRPAAESEAA